MFQAFKKYGAEVHHYHSDSDIYTLKLEMREKFTDLHKWRTISTNLQGRFTTHHQFEIKPKWQFGYSKNMGRPSLQINGELLPNGLKTEIVISVDPFPYKAPLFASIAVGLFGLFRFSENLNIVVLITALLLIFGIPYIILRLVLFEKEKLRETFAKTFGLKYVKTY
jgi:hypothetical protein